MIRSLLALSAPIVVVQVGMMLMGVVDTIMVGRVSATDLAAVALGNVYFFGVTIVGFGVVLAVDPILSQAHGAGDTEGIARGIQRGLLLSAALSVPTSMLAVPGEWVLTLLGQPADVVPVAAQYARASILGVLPFFLFGILRQQLQAVGVTAPIVLTVVAANVVNVPLNWVMIYGELGFPAMGAVGAGWATSACKWFMVLSLVLIGWKWFRPTLTPVRSGVASLKPMIRLMILGIPLGVQMLVEFATFGGVALLMGRMGTATVAANQIALNLASLTFMVPLGISMAGSVLVGRGVGAQDMLSARRAAAASVWCGAAFMSATAVLLLTIPEALARIYTQDESVLRVAVVLLPLAGVFQVFDGLQVVLGGILRGLGETRAQMTMNLVGFWGLGVPTSLLLAYGSGYGPAGLWWGLVVGLAAVAVGLFFIVRLKIRREVSRVSI